MTTTRTGALFHALAASPFFPRPNWITQPTLQPVAVGASLGISGGVVSGAPAPTISFQAMINGVAETLPYRPMPADAGQPYVITPIATSLGIQVSGNPFYGTVPAYSLFYGMSVGQNAPADSASTTMRVFNDRALVGGFYITPYGSGVLLPDANKDPTTGLPTSAFGMKFAEGALMSDPSVNGTWVVYYSSPVKRTPTVTGGTLLTDVWTSGNGVVTFSYAVGNPFLFFSLDGGVTAFRCFDPTTFATWGVGGTPPMFSDQILGTTTPYSYMRLMDLANSNQDYVNLATGTWANDTVAWSDRRTPANFYVGKMTGLNCGYPLEWLVGLGNAAGKSIWVNIPELADDPYITNYATLVAQQLNAGLTVTPELSNEDFNSGGAFFTYRKSGYSGQVEVLGFLPSNTQLWSKTCLGGGYVSTFSSDGTTATVVFAGGGHTLPVGVTTYVPAIISPQTGMANWAATGVATVVDAVTITYPTARPSSGGAVAATTVLQASGMLCINGASNLIGTGGAGNAFDLRLAWHRRRAWQMAGLFNAAWAAAGRNPADCTPVFCIQAGSGTEAQWSFGAKNLVNFIAAISGGGKLKDRFKAIGCGGYLCLDQPGNLNAGYGLTATHLTPTDTPTLLAQLGQMSARVKGTYSYQTFVAWVKDQGLEAWGYEIGLDTIGAGGQSTATQNAATAANADPGIQPLITQWVQGLAEVGFTRIGWFQTSTGTYAGFGCFNLGQTVAEVSLATPSANQSPKFKGLIAGMSAWSSPPTDHVVPCTISGYDVTGNEPVVTVGSNWPSLSGANLPATGLYNGTGSSQTYKFRLECATPQPVVVVVSGDVTTASAITITAHVCNGLGTPDGSFVTSGIKTAQEIGRCTVIMQPGANYVTLTASSNAAAVFPHTVQTI